MAPTPPTRSGRPGLAGAALYTKSLIVMRALLWRLLYPVAVWVHRLTGRPAPQPPFDERRAAALVGKYVLIGLTTYDADGRMLEHRQIHGTIVAIDAAQGIDVQLKGRGYGETFRLPPDLRPLKRARPGEYRLRSTGEVLTDPDLVCSWSVTNPRS
jgi:hypothetical protein